MRQANFPGEHFAFREILVEGPTPAALAVEEWRRMRIDYLSPGGSNREEVERDMSRQEELLDSISRYEEVVLWFEHDLFCQIHLIYLLNRFADVVRGNARLSLICIDRFPGIEDFRGLGQLTAEQMASLFDTRREITDEETYLARRAWQAYCAPTPAPLQEIAIGDASALPFLKPALRLHLARFPSKRNGLGRIENLALDLIFNGKRDFKSVFPEFGKAAPGYGFGDRSFWDSLMKLASSTPPVLTISGVAEPMEATQSGQYLNSSFEISDFGEKIRRSEADFVSECGIDSWLGGVHLRSGAPMWRFDEQAGRVALAA
jgi:hypothetical protein